MAPQTNALLHASYRCSGEQNASQLTALLQGMDVLCQDLQVPWVLTKKHVHCARLETLNGQR